MGTSSRRILVVSWSLPYTAHLSSADVTPKHHRSRSRSSSIIGISLHEDPIKSVSQEEEPTSNAWKFQKIVNHPGLFLAGLKDSEIVNLGTIGPIYDKTGEAIKYEDIHDTSPLLTAYKNPLSDKKCIPIILESANESSLHYSNHILRPLLHYQLFDRMVLSGILDTSGWDTFLDANQQFCDAIVEVWQPNDLIWIADYRLLLLPRLIRERLEHDANIGLLFNTVPFPTSEIFRNLPQARDILRGMLGSNVIAFQTYSDARHFISSCTRLLGVDSLGESNFGVEYNGLPVRVQVIPWNIDDEDLLREVLQSYKEEILSCISRTLECFQNQKIIIGIESGEQARGAIHKLYAFEWILKNHPDVIGHINLIQIIQSNSPESREENSPLLVSRLNEISSHINDQYGSLGYTPVYLYTTNRLDKTEYYGLLSAANVCILMGEREGANPVGPEYVACQMETGGCGELIISKFSGMSKLLHPATKVNPRNYAEVGKAIYNAIFLNDGSSKQKLENLWNIISNNRLSAWSQIFAKEIETSYESMQLYSPTPQVCFPTVFEWYQRSRSRLILLDYDGTLTPIRPVPKEAAPGAETMRTLRLLTSDPRNIVYVISGRDQATLDAWLGRVPGLGLR